MGRMKLIIGGAIVLVGGIILFSSMFVVHQVQTALVLQFGRPVIVLSVPGLHFKLPWQDVEYFDRRILDLDPPAQEVILQDKKRVNVDSFVRYRIVNPLEFKKTAVTQTNFIQIFGGRLNAAVRAEIGKVLLGDMLSAKRNDVMTRITDALKTQATQFGIEVVDVRIGRTDLPEATAESVYKRMNSEREAQARKLRSEGSELKAKIQAKADKERTVVLATAQREAQILRGQGEGKKTIILNEAFGQDPEFFAFYRSMEAYGEALGEGTSMVLSPDSEFFKYFIDKAGSAVK